MNHHCVFEGALLSCLCFGLVLGGCGDSKSESAPNEGPAVCTPGATQSCLGPGACRGAQRCKADGSEWELCDCGTQGAPSETSDEGLRDAGITDVTNGGEALARDANVRDSLTDSSQGLSAEAGGEDVAISPNGLKPQDDPCPSSPITMNCSSSCGPLSSTCLGSKCGFSGPKGPYIDDPKAFPLVIRTASYPGLDRDCMKVCDPDKTAWGFALDVAPPRPLDEGQDPAKMRYRIRVAPPWRIAYALGASSEICARAHTVLNCLVAGSLGPGAVEITTADPDAPARNVTIELLENPSCS